MKLLRFYGKNEAYFVGSVAFFGFGCAILISLGLFVIKCHVFSKVNSVSTSMISFGILASIFYSLASIFWGLFWLCSVNIISNVLFFNLFNLFQIFCWHLGQVMVYCYLLTRLYMGFKGTVYSIKRNRLIILSVLLLCYIFACCILLGNIIYYVIWYSKNPNNNVESLPFDNYFVYSYKSITLAVDLILSTALLKIFINKLHKINESLQVMINNEYSLITEDDPNIDSAFVNDRQALKAQHDNIDTVLSKVFILGVILIVTSQIILTLSLVNWIFMNDILNIIYAWIRAFHTFIASLSVFLGFEFTHNWYICCCGRYHTCIKRCITTKTLEIRQSLQFDFSSKSQR